MLGQSSVVGTVVTVVIVSVFVVTGLLIYGYVINSTPHDVPYYNETICTTCANSTLYEFDNYYVNNDSSLVCTNGSGSNAMTNGIDRPGNCLGYNIVADRYLNITNTTATVGQCSWANVRCDYEYNWATDDEQSFWDNSTDISFSGFVLTAVIVIVLGAIAVIGIIMVLSKS